MNVTRFAEKLLDIGNVAPSMASVLTAVNADPASSASYRKLLDLSGLRPSDFADLVATAHNLPRFDLADLSDGASLADRFSRPFLHEAGLYPYRSADDQLRLAVADPGQQEAIEAIALTLGDEVGLVIATFEDVELALGRPAASEGTASEPRPDDDAGREDIDSLRDLASGAPVVRALEDIFDRAVGLRATDIHIEPLPRDFQVRLRVDGIMRSLPQVRGITLRALISRVKILSGINIAEHRVPQDGRTRVLVRGREFDVRVATMPTTGGEAAILRLLERGDRLVAFAQLGFSRRNEAVMRRQLAMPHGLFVVTGPTGSGKTTTLAAAIALLNDTTRKILTIEDPVEYEIPGIAQSQVKPAVGLSFASALKAFLRQDPDVIMVGEVRDAETAKIAIQASLTGHLVMTTLHTNTAAAAVTRLVDIGIEPYLLASTLTAVVGQRLVRVLCPDCRRAATVTRQQCDGDARYAALGIEAGTRLHEPVGCERCGQMGYRGRRAIFEVLEMTDSVRGLVLAGADDAAIEQAAQRDGMTTMVEDGRARCLDGVTSLEEVFRVAALRGTNTEAASAI
ncbi:MAG TPA: ATPase, T2SS/T4P/T4SS family [Rhodopseudomonas sp.]|uniref:GspE/PulE family protein n=1 Tax=Rhodopseudomonas sp. TaxID=1078 RepID=UPI002ED7FC96